MEGLSKTCLEPQRITGPTVTQYPQGRPAWGAAFPPVPAKLRGRSRLTRKKWGVQKFHLRIQHQLFQSQFPRANGVIN